MACAGYGSDQSDLKTKADFIGSITDGIAITISNLQEIDESLERPELFKTSELKIMNNAIYEIEQRLFNISAHISARANNPLLKFPTKL